MGFDTIIANGRWSRRPILHQRRRDYRGKDRSNRAKPPREMRGGLLMLPESTSCLAESMCTRPSICRSAGPPSADDFATGTAQNAFGGPRAIDFAIQYKARP